MSDRTVTVTYDLPTDISAYNPSTHFLERLKYRTDPEPTEAIATEVVETGTLHHTHKRDRVIFEQDLYRPGDLSRDEPYTWRVLVAVNPDAFHRADAYHTLLTIYANNVHDADHSDVFETQDQ